MGGQHELALVRSRPLFSCSRVFLSRVSCSQRATSRGYFKKFYVRRMPANFSAGITVSFSHSSLRSRCCRWLLAHWLVSPPAKTYQQLSNHQPWLWTYTHNFLQAEGPSQLPGLGHIWSLAVEEQFYLVWPVVVFFFSGTSPCDFLPHPLRRNACPAYGSTERWGDAVGPCSTGLLHDSIPWHGGPWPRRWLLAHRQAVGTRMPSGSALGALLGLLGCGLVAGDLEKLSLPMQDVGLHALRLALRRDRLSSGPT